MGRELVVPGIYKHFKGNLYVAIGVSYPKEEMPLGNSVKIRHTELWHEFWISSLNGKFTHHQLLLDSNPLVLYKSLNDDSPIFARPLDSFLSEVDSRKHPHVKQKYRMELVGGLFEQ